MADALQTDSSVAQANCLSLGVVWDALSVSPFFGIYSRSRESILQQGRD